MKSFPTKTHQFLIIALMIGFVFLSALSFPGQTNARQSISEPTPTSTVLAENGISGISGNTEGLMWGAGVILVIILSGVLIQRVINKPDSDQQQ